MKRIKIMGLALIAVFAMTAVATSAASAAEPAFYECAKVAAGTGKYLKGCKTEGTGKAAAYEIKEGIGKAKEVKGTGKKATLHTPAVGGVVTCTGFKDEFKLTSPTHESKLFSTFTGCVSLGKKCTTPGQKAGTIKTKELEGDLGYISAAEHRVGADLKAVGGGELAEFGCEGLQINVTGSVIGEVTPVNTFTKKTTTTFAVNGEGFQTVQNLEGQPKDVLFSLVNGSGPFESGQEAAAVNAGEELDLKA